MKNADMPAMPCSMPNDPMAVAQARACGIAIPDSVSHQGLTKREMMAMHAPEIPGWFEDFWKNKNETNDSYFCTMAIPLLLTKTRYVREITKDGSKALYFAWRTHFADALLEELERSTKN